jgi:DNA polymerase (family 10)
MTKEQVAAVLHEIGVLLELRGENSFRCNAYFNGARSLEQLEEDLETVVRTGRLGSLPGIGETLREKITTLVTTGRLPFYEDLKQKTPPGLLKMLRIQGLGPKKVKALHDQLGITDLDQLRQACEQDRVAGLKGFGKKTQEKILEGLAFLDEVGERVRLDQALPIAQGLLEGLRDVPGVVRIALCGSLRRRRETVKDIDLLVSATDPHPITERFLHLAGVRKVIGTGETKSSVVLGDPSGAGRVVLNCDLRVVRDEQFPYAQQHFSGSKEHNVAMRGRAQARGYKMNEYELLGPSGPVPCKTEADIYAALGLAYIPPELRENTGEIEAAEAGSLPELVGEADIQGVFHNHTTASDGSASLEEMAEAARALGLKYLGIGDHSQSLYVANGLSPERVRRQQAEIDALNARYGGDFRIFKGTECDILEDGSLDFDDELLATFDYVVASVHSHFKQTREEMTARIVKAVRHPLVTMLGHATGRLLLQREGYQVDLEAVLQAAAAAGTMVEINAQPLRLDLDWVHCKRARALGVRLVINPDAHSTGELGYYLFGVHVARRGWLTKADVFNTHGAAEVAQAFAERRRRAGVQGV